MVTTKKHKSAIVAFLTAVIMLVTAAVAQADDGPVPPPPPPPVTTPVQPDPPATTDPGDNGQAPTTPTPTPSDKYFAKDDNLGTLYWLNTKKAGKLRNKGEFTHACGQIQVTDNDKLGRKISDKISRYNTYATVTEVKGAVKIGSGCNAGGIMWPMQDVAGYFDVLPVGAGPFSFKYTIEDVDGVSHTATVRGTVKEVFMVKVKFTKAGVKVTNPKSNLKVQFGIAGRYGKEQWQGIVWKEWLKPGQSYTYRVSLAQRKVDFKYGVSYWIHIPLSAKMYHPSNYSPAKYELALPKSGISTVPPKAKVKVKKRKATVVLSNPTTSAKKFTLRLKKARAGKYRTITRKVKAGKKRTVKVRLAKKSIIKVRASGMATVIKRVK